MKRICAVAGFVVSAAFASLAFGQTGAVVAGTGPGTAGIAQAADMPVKAPLLKAPPVPAYEWTGFYFGLNAGVSVGRNTQVDRSIRGDIARLWECDGTI